jgi:cell division protein ZapD
VILYEYPFNERIRTYLRLEQLFRRLGELIARAHSVDHHFAIQTLFEIMDVAARSDLKADIMKDLERHKQQLDGYRGNPAISEAALDQFIARLDECFQALDSDPGRVGSSLGENEWLMAIRNRMSIPGGTCEFDLPAYHEWLHRPVEARQRDLAEWSRELEGLAAALRMLMKLLRDSGMPQKVVATGGQLQQHLPQGRSYQLLRLRVDPALDVIPEISGNRLLFSVRLMRRGENGRLQACDIDAPLEVTLCA